MESLEELTLKRTNTPTYSAWQFEFSPKSEHSALKMLTTVLPNTTLRVTRRSRMIDARRWLAEELKTPKEQAIASSSMQCSSTKAKGQSTEYGGLRFINATQVCILNRECSEAEIEIKLPDRECTNVFTFQDKLVFIGDLRSKNNPGSKRVDLMDLSSFQVSSLPDMIKAKCFPVGVASENEIFIFSHDLKSDVHRVKELLPPSRWSLLPPMIEERSWCAAVNIPDSGVLVIGGIGRNELPLRSTELLTRRSGEEKGGGGEKWQWIPNTQMNEKHGGHPLAVYFQGRIYVVGYGENVDTMEMLDVAAGGQWTSLNFYPQRFSIKSMARVGNELFVNC
ncbi:unnamed protein product [Hymenolepis diminuta]|uniref:F-box/kelch-repeat protein n=1 Tax=Hymenolepis diminuta TaxID=6216 RepID=A0A0R3SWL7_HYMDI|nr:unnamed protein product [Hymenolepis diminuta]